MISVTALHRRRTLFSGGSAGVVLVAACAGLWVVGAQAQTASGKRPTTPPSQDAGEEEAVAGDVVVNAQRAPTGSVVGEIKPELSLSPSDIQSYGVSSVADLLEELTPQTRSERGRGGETPVVLLNGRRISSFNEIHDIPTEAIQRVDILPEEVGLKYGYDANQKVVNIVLRRRFRAIAGEGVVGGATGGGLVNGQEEGDLLNLRNNDRFNLDLRVQESSNLTQAERHLRPATANGYAPAGNLYSATPGAALDPGFTALVGAPVSVVGVPAVATTRPLVLADLVATAGVPNPSNDTAARTLIPESRQVTLNDVFSRSVLGGWSATVNGTLNANHSEALEGLPGVSLVLPTGDSYSPFSRPVVLRRSDGDIGALRQTVDGWTGHLGLAVDRDFREWRVSLTTAYDHADTLTITEAGVDASALQARLAALDPSFNPFAALPASGVARLPDAKARQRTEIGNVQAVLNGPLLQLPAGPFYASVKVGDTVSALSAQSTRSGVEQLQYFRRNAVNAQLNLDLPLASRRRGVMQPLGDFTLNANVASAQLSDFGTLMTYGFGSVWSPLPGLTLIASNTEDQAAPSQQQLGGPVIYTPNQQVFDYATGQTVSVTQVSGGNAALAADLRDVWKLGLTWKAPIDQDLTFSVNYTSSRIKNAIATFPAATAAIETAFPTRFLRNSAGQLIEEDLRPVNFARQDRSELRWGFDFSMPIGPQPQQQRRPDNGGDDQRRSRDGAGGSRSSGGGGGGRGFGGGFGGMAAMRAGRLQFAFYHTVYFTDEILVRAGGPRLDLLNGAAAGAGGGQPQHELEAQFGYLKDGYGLRLSADWKSATTVTGAPGSPTGDLSFSESGTINLRWFANFGAMPEMVKAWPALRGSRLTLAANNLFDARQSVRDGTGATPASYQSAFLDPAGRTLRLSFRKLFF
jgi:iron complex outermembrane receptor protein